MALGDITALRIESIAATGTGLARTENGCVFVDLAAPGDLLRLKITEEQRGWARAEILEILEASPQRIKPLCSLYGICGGCNFGHLNYKAQLAAKKNILEESFERITGFIPANIRIVPSEPWEYRNRVQFHCPGNKKLIGLIERKGKKIIPLSDCPIADPGIREALRDPEKKCLCPPVHKDRFNVYSRGDLFLSEGGNRRGKLIMGENKKNLVIDAGVFFQSNYEMLEILLEDLENLAKDCVSLPLADIYCGIGTFSALIGDNFPEIELIEENKTALALARENVYGKNRRFYAIKADDWIKNTRPDNKTWGLIIADPPRTGLSPGLKQFLAVSKVKTLAYVSCDPVTLARDSKTLCGSGFSLKELTLYDFYPQTSHIESLAIFCRERNSGD